MNGFADREKGFEAKYRADQETEFRIIARRNRYFGEWAAERMGLAGDEVAVYAREVVNADFEKPGHIDVIEKVARDLEARGAPASDAELHRKLDEMAATARRDILTAK